MSKTIKQIADELGVSKQAIQKRLSREPLLSSVAPYISTVNGTKHIAVDGENLIKSAFSKNGIDTMSIDTSIDNNNTSIDKSIPVSIDENTASIPKSIDKRGVSIDGNKPYTPESIDKSDLEKTVKELETALSEKENYINSQTDDLKAAQEKIKEFETANAELKIKSNGLETALSEKKNYISALEADKERANESIDDLKNQLKEKEASAKEEREKERQERQTILTRLWQTEDKNKALETELNKYKALVDSKGESLKGDEQPIKTQIDDPPQPEPQPKQGFFKRLFGFFKRLFGKRS